MQLYGKSRREAVSFLKEVPPPFTLVCCRRLFDDEASVDEPRTTEASLPETEVLNEYTVVPIGVPIHPECPKECIPIFKGRENTSPFFISL